MSAPTRYRFVGRRWNPAAGQDYWVWYAQYGAEYTGETYWIEPVTGFFERKERISG